MSQSDRSIASRVTGDEVLRRLERAIRPKTEDYVVLVASDVDRSPFALLVATILSQNTNDRNSIKAYLSLRLRIGISPEDIARASEQELTDAIRVAGLATRKAKTLKSLASRVMEAGGERVLVAMEPFKLREFLLSVPGVGQKTADVFLSFYRRAPVFAVDTHAARIARRWGLVGERASYEEISQKLLEFFGPERAEEAHRMLIALGRAYCAARKPKCSSCPLADVCPWPHRCP
uniref:Endonuclease III n=1 Tax=Fervidicoccus fontis TaxID=683846 RepID=A0A7J3ZJ14_9CREN